MNLLEINRLIATQVMGWELAYTVETPESNTIIYTDKDGNTHKNFDPTSDIDSAWEALDKVCHDNDWVAVIKRANDYTDVHFQTKMGSVQSYFGERIKTTMSICEAVLRTVGIQLDDISDNERLGL